MDAYMSLITSPFFPSLLLQMFTKYIKVSLHFLCELDGKHGGSCVLSFLRLTGVVIFKQNLIFNLLCYLPTQNTQNILLHVSPPLWIWTQRRWYIYITYVTLRTFDNPWIESTSCTLLPFSPLEFLFNLKFQTKQNGFALLCCLFVTCPSTTECWFAWGVMQHISHDHNIWIIFAFCFR